ncbi:hypothetical protein AB6A40_005143 [Gnathostoma spinigerum]|uniref:Uncharacterized protein n=1 Tax=Gnathostoma spinigerum TaxID=75299 RepID=A0ABD6EEK7_9BILA
MLKLGKNCEFIPTTYPTAHNVKIAFKKFSRALCPSWVFNDDQSASFYKQVDDSGWLQMVASLLHLASAITVLIDIQRSSVALCLEDGWDATCQISALSQIMLDPYYRTHDGFRVLIEKEWLSFGHRFSHRANHSAASQSSGIAPMFLMFLDAVHQILVQYPSAFEFNDFFLRFLAYHSASTCFRTFVLDSEADRITVDLLTISAADPRSASVWTYISEKRQKSPIFENFCYTSDVYGVLRPQTSIASIELWEFYSEDHLAHGSSYDIEVAEVESQQREDEQFECLTEIQTPRTKFYRVIDASYRSIHLLRLDAFSFQLNKFSKLLSLLGGEGENNTEIWNKIVAITDDKGYTGFPDHDERHMLENWRRHMQRAVHKKETVKLLLRGISHQSSSSRLRDNNAAASTGHRFMQQSVTPGDVCVVCHQNISENIVRSVQRCSGCGMVSHEKCVLAVSSVCFGNLEYRNTSASAKQDAGLDAMTPTSVEAVDRTLTISAGRSCPNITHSGVLMKKGVTFKMWKPRWFVLDWSRHQLRYYESEMDASCRGIIELADITNIEISSNHTLRKPLIEIRTNRRIYSLLAGSKTDGEIWMEKLTAALKD